MNDADYIRRGVELADGFEIDSNTLTGMEFISLPLTSAQAKRGMSPHWREINDFSALDALAAQLVRQVRQIAIAQKKPWLWTRFRKVVVGASLKDDLTMNTIHAIVDSKVLEGGK